MCVILVVDSKRPSEDLVNKAWKQNDHGGGIAYREGEFVRWEKGLELKDMQEFAKSLPMPYVLHFRIASTGGRSQYLCHPFEASRSANFKLTGKTKNAVVFHNGTWHGWRHSLLDAVIKSRAGKLPSGPWNDTRGLAFMAHLFGPGALEMINERTVYFSPRELEIYGDGWEEESDILMSNTIFLKNFQGNGQAQGHQQRSGWTPPSVQPGGTESSNQGAGSSVAHGNGGVPRLVQGQMVSAKETIHVISAAERAKGGPSLDIPFRGSITIVGRGENQPQLLEEDSEQLLEAAGAGGEQHSAKPLSDDQIEWVRSLNPSSYKGSSVTPQEAAQFIERINLSQKGIEYVGRM